MKPLKFENFQRLRAKIDVKKENFKLREENINRT